MFIADSHVHLWKNGAPPEPHRPRPHSMEDALRGMDEAGVSKALLYPPFWDADGSAIAFDAARRHPERFAVMGWLPLDDPRREELIEDLRGQPGLLGLRFTFIRPEQKSWLFDGTMDWLWPAAERAGLPVGLSTSTSFPAIGEAATRHPALRLIVDHMGILRGRYGDAAFESLPDLLQLAKLPNVAVKVSGGPGYVREPYPFPTLSKHYRRIYDAFGPARMFWGTDITRMPCSWRECITHITEELDWLSPHDRELIMGQALCDWLRWPIVDAKG